MVCPVINFIRGIFSTKFKPARSAFVQPGGSGQILRLRLLHVKPRREAQKYVRSI